MVLNLTSRRASKFGLLVLGTLFLLPGGVANAQNLDQGKTGQKLFADSCVTCHRSPRGLAKGRIHLTLTYFLRQHYSSGPDTASALADYLQSVDTPPPGKPRGNPKRSSHVSQRPPASIPQR
jgi:mono/diheme cytochrome c family protein